MWRIAGERQMVTSNSHCTVWSVPVRRDDASVIEEQPFLVLDRKDSVLVAAYDMQGRLAFVRQHRFAGDIVGWELPQGAIEEGEDSMSAARRELSEETCLEPSVDPLIIGHLYEASDWCTSKCFIVVLREVALQSTGMPELEWQWFGADEILEHIHSGEITDAATLAALYLLISRP